MDREFLKEISQSLTRLHKALLDAEMEHYARQFGFPAKAGERLQLVLAHPQFQWLRALSQLIAEIDDLAFSKKPFQVDAGARAIDKTRELMLDASEFQNRVAPFTQSSPEINNLLQELKGRLRT
jgi:hypothetical protein